MRLGVVFAGDGVHAAANLGVLEDLYARGMEPYAVCGIHAGAWPAALFGAGHDMENMKKALHQAARMGKRLADGPLTFPWKRGGASILRSGRIEHLLRAQTGDLMLALCPRRALFLCRAAVSGRRVIFSSQLYLQDAGALLSMQAGAGFAARAAMALPPFLPPKSWMGNALVPDGDTAFACGQLLAMGAQRVLVVLPVPSPRRAPDALDLAGQHAMHAAAGALPPDACMLRVTMPDTVGALSFDGMLLCGQAGREAAQAQLDALFERMGMAQCRVLPFRRPPAAQGLGG